jgi:hypothetical protein
MECFEDSLKLIAIAGDLNSHGLRSDFMVGSRRGWNRLNGKAYVELPAILNLFKVDAEW